MRRLMIAASEALQRTSETKTVECSKEFKAPRLVGDPSPENPNRLEQRVAFGKEFRFGITRGPTLAVEAAEQFEQEIEGSFKQISAGSAVGLEGGRLNEGLESLIDSYLKQFAACRDPRGKAAES